MTSQPIEQSRVKRGLIALLIFIAGALFGAFVFFVVTMVRPEPPALPVAETPPPVAPSAVTSPPLSAPPVVENAPSVAPAPAPQAAAPLVVPPAPPPPAPPEAQPPAPPSPAAPVDAVPADQPRKGTLIIPVVGVTAPQLSDTFNETRGGKRRHEALDILAPRGTPVIAVDDGKVVKLFKSIPGGLTIYQFDPGERLAYYYAHLDGYAPDLAEGKQLKRGDVIGYVGTTGNVNPATPHLHFAIFELGPEKRWWKGTAINPYPWLTGR